VQSVPIRGLGLGVLVRSRERRRRWSSLRESWGGGFGEAGPEMDNRRGQAREALKETR